MNLRKKGLLYLFICNLSKDDVSTSFYLTSKNWKTANTELKLVQGRAAVAYLKVLPPQNLPVITEENVENSGYCANI